MERQFLNEYINPNLSDLVTFAINADSAPANDANRNRFVSRKRAGNNPLNSRADSEHAVTSGRGNRPYLIFDTTE